MLCLCADDPDRWRLDLSRLLKEFCCPYKDVISRLVNGDVKDTKDHLKILCKSFIYIYIYDDLLTVRTVMCVTADVVFFYHAVFLASELQAAEMLASKPATDADVESNSSLQDLQAVCRTLNLPDPIGQETRDVLAAVEKQVLSHIQQHMTGVSLTVLISSSWVFSSGL